MNAIVSVTRDWGIGRNGGLVVRNRADMRFFRETTMGGTVVCGRTTFESFPGGALKGRRNVVLSRNPTFMAQGAEVVASVDDALRTIYENEAFEEPTEASVGTCFRCAGQSTPELEAPTEASVGTSTHDVWIIGGESVYRALLDKCARAFVTYHDTSVPVDAYFPNLDIDDAWELEDVLGSGTTEQGIAYEFRVYRNLRLLGEVLSAARLGKPFGDGTSAARTDVVETGTATGESGDA
ncbi:MAG: dihydrofolate reductase [Atopobiaceae bacterium]|nr:dihydrofolate reductase [Atopobiaceae bacterium]